ncbi:MAG: hypothetical protein P8N13_09560 [Ilumatobacter sp.]|nr:hypothetical protein [Ilumatobacter sp.]
MRYQLPITTNKTAFPNHPEMWDHLYTAQDYRLAEELGVDSNHDAEQLIQQELKRTNSNTTITFNSEHLCFFAHMENDDDRKALDAAVQTLIAAARSVARRRHLTVAPEQS